MQVEIQHDACWRIKKGRSSSRSFHLHIRLMNCQYGYNNRQTYFHLHKMHEYRKYISMSNLGWCANMFKADVIIFLLDMLESLLSFMRQKKRKIWYSSNDYILTWHCIWCGSFFIQFRYESCEIDSIKNMEQSRLQFTEFHQDFIQ